MLIFGVFDFRYLIANSGYFVEDVVAWNENLRTSDGPNLLYQIKLYIPTIQNSSERILSKIECPYQ